MVDCDSSFTLENLTVFLMEMTRMQPCHISDIYLKGKQNSRGVRIIFKISL